MSELNQEIPLYHIPPVTKFGLNLSAKYTLLHILSDDTKESLASLQSRFETERDALEIDLQLIHIFVSPNPVAFSLWLSDIQSTARVYWYGPEDSDCPVISHKAVSTFPYYLIYEGEDLIVAGEKVPEHFAALLGELEERKLRKIAENATGWRLTDASSEVICGMIVHQVVQEALIRVKDSVVPATLPSSPDLLHLGANPEADKVLEQQKALIETLKAQVNMREKEVEELRLFA